MTTKINDELAALFTEVSETICQHGEHADWCRACDEIRKCAQVRDFPTHENNPPARFDLVVVGYHHGEQIVEGGALPQKVRDEDDHDDVAGVAPCTSCWTVPARNGSCAC